MQELETKKKEENEESLRLVSIVLDEKKKKQKIDEKRKPEQAKKQQGGQTSAKAKRQQMAQNRREESLKEVLGFFINMIDEAKYERSKPRQRKLEIFRSGGGEEINREEVIQNEFLNKNEFSEFKGFYDDLGFGDLVLIFPNPDFEGVANRGVKFKEAEKIFDEILTVMSDDGVSKSQMQKERNSFLYAFLMLNNFVEEEVGKPGGSKQSEQEEIEQPISRLPGHQVKPLTSWELYQEFLKQVGIL